MLIDREHPSFSYRSISERQMIQDIAFESYSYYHKGVIQPQEFHTAVRPLHSRVV